MADASGPLPLTLRLATLADADFLLTLRNEPSVRAVSSDSREVQLDEHIRWLVGQLNPSRHAAAETGLYIAEVKGTPIGSGRIYKAYDSEHRWQCGQSDRYVCWLSYSLLPQYRGKGYGRQLVAFLVKLAQDKGHTTIGCRIKRDNWRSLKVAVMNGVNMIEVFP